MRFVNHKDTGRLFGGAPARAGTSGGVEDGSISHGLTSCAALRCHSGFFRGDVSAYDVDAIFRDFRIKQEAFGRQCVRNSARRPIPVFDRRRPGPHGATALTAPAHLLTDSAEATGTYRAILAWRGSVQPNATGLAQSLSLGRVEKSKVRRSLVRYPLARSS